MIAQHLDLIDDNDEADDLDMPILTPPADHQKKFVFEGINLPSDIINNAHSGNLNNFLIVNQKKKIRPTCNAYF